MKKVIFHIALLIGIVTGVQAQDNTASNPTNPNAPKFKFKSEVIDYGTIERNANGDREFKFTNTGKEPLIITHAAGSCQCTVPVWSKEPIMPGDSSIIKVHYNTDRVGSFEKTVTITSNADTPQKVLKIKGVVKQDATSAPASAEKK